MGFHHIPKPPRIVALGGPVSAAIRAMRADEPATDYTRIRELRRAIADRIEADLALLDALVGDADFEDGADDNGIADEGGLAEQRGTVWFGTAEELCSQTGEPLCWSDGLLVSESLA